MMPVPPGAGAGPATVVRAPPLVPVCCRPIEIVGVACAKPAKLTAPSAAAPTRADFRRPAPFHLYFIGLSPLPVGRGLWKLAVWRGPCWAHAKPSIASMHVLCQKDGFPHKQCVARLGMLCFPQLVKYTDAGSALGKGPLNRRTGPPRRAFAALATACLLVSDDSGTPFRTSLAASSPDPFWLVAVCAYPRRDWLSMFNPGTIITQMGRIAAVRHW